VTGTDSHLALSGSRNFVNWLAEHQLSLAFSTYQAGKLFFVGLSERRQLSIFERTFARCMGIGLDPRSQGLWVASLYQIWKFENALQPGQNHQGYDRVYVPQVGYTTGDVDVHDIAVDDQGPVFVNTLFSCLARPSDRYSFEPIWQPPFISRLAAEDRCHLNGLALKDGQPAYVTCVSTTDVNEGWREHRASGGVVIDVQSNELVADGLSMPHSPRWHDDKIWACNSGTGDIGWIDTKKKSFQPEFFCPGFLRGLAFHNGYVMSTLSKPRYKRFEGLGLDERLTEKDADAWCGVQIISMANGNVEHWLRLDGAITEMFDICVLPGVKNPLTLGPLSPEILGFITIEAPESPLWRGDA